MSTITTIQSSDALSASRSVINTNFSNLNTDKLETTTAASTYAPIAKGVTNGDSHDHVGGDGASIPIGGISATGTPSASNFLRGDGTWTAPSGTGDVVGPASAVSGRVATFNGTTGKLIQDSGLTISGSNTGDQTTIVGITGTLAQFNTAVTDADFATIAGTETLTGKTLTTPVLNGTPTGTGVATAATASTLALRDASGNSTFANLIEGFTTTVTAAGTTTLTVASTFTQVFTGATTQTIVLPTTSIVAGQSYVIINNSTGIVTVQSSGLNTIVTMSGGTSAQFIALVATPTTAANWTYVYNAVSIAFGKKFTANNTMAISGTDGTTMTFPSTSATIARTDAANTFTGVQTMTSPVLTTPNIGTPSAGTLTSCTGLPVAGLVASTATALGVGSVELGHASDTTIARVSAGVISVEGVTVPTISSTSTLTNKRITSRVQSVANAATITPNADSDDCVDITAIAQAFTIANPSGTPTNFQKLIIRIKDNGTARPITWGPNYAAGGVDLPTTTVLSKITTIGLIYNTANALNKFQCVAVATEA